MDVDFPGLCEYPDPRTGRCLWPARHLWRGRRLCDHHYQLAESSQVAHYALGLLEQMRRRGDCPGCGEGPGNG